jgi:hypothetical protein
MGKNAVRAEAVALFDMDGTLCDHEGQLRKDLKKLQAPGEPDFLGDLHRAPEHIKRRAEMIMSSQVWWEGLPRLQLGWDVLQVAREQGYRIMILTQGPNRYPSAWSGKKLWIDRNLGPGTDVTITRDKGLVYGKVLVDDYPEYVKRWLTWRRNGLVIMPANGWNGDFGHRQVVRYDGTNLDEVSRAMLKRLRRDTR